MKTEEKQRRLLFILHRGLVEARLLAQSKNHEQLFDLTDALELIPGIIVNWNEERLAVIQFSLKSYRMKYPSPSFDYLRYLDVEPPPENF